MCTRGPAHTGPSAPQELQMYGIAIRKLVSLVSDLTVCSQFSFGIIPQVPHLVLTSIGHTFAVFGFNNERIVPIEEAEATGDDGGRSRAE
jgi:hypothetical protein